MNYWRTMYKFAWILLAGLILASGFFLFTPQLRRLSENQKKRERIREENRRIQQDTAALQRKQERFGTDPAFVERTAKEIGMARTNEIIVKYIDESPTSTGGTP